MVKADEKLHIKGLNGLRAIAAFAVIISHTNRRLEWFNLPVKETLDLAPYGVTIFFALSGFLITYLLLKEREKTGDISIPKFYMRRILRIWPLYYSYFFLTLIVAWLFHDKQLDPVGIGLYVFMMPNVAHVLDKTILMNHHFWSLGVEEQFYSFWPWSIRKSSNVLLFLGLFISIFMLVKIAMHFLHYNIVSDILKQNAFDCMAIGGLGGYFYFKENALLLKYARMWALQIAAWGCVVACAFNHFHIMSIIDNNIMACVAVILIVNVSAPKQSLINLENRFFDFLGRISFGLYVYHMLVIFLLGKMLCNVNLDTIPKLVLVYSSCLLCTIAVAYLSYTYMESWFIAQKGKFSTILSKSSDYFKD